MPDKIVLVLDCGATNVRTIAVNEKGQLVARSSLPNNTQPDPLYSKYKIWDINEIWDKLCKTTGLVVKQINKSNIAGVTVTTFGVDCAPVTKTGELIYPVISWACERTAPIMENIDKYIPLTDLYALNGLNKFSFNTINKLIWFKENHPEILDKADFFAFISAILLNKLSGELVSEKTMAGTSMLTDISSQQFSEKILSRIGIKNNIFPPIVEAGQIIGHITKRAFEQTGIPENIPVIATGHDTQFAIFGSGAKEDQPVLSSGTWEILMVRTSKVNTNVYALENGVTTEFDSIPKLYNAGIQWLASGVLEWIKKMYYSKEIAEMPGDAIYELMIDEAKKADLSGKLKISVDFLNSNGIISGLGLDTKRQEIYLAALHALAEKMKSSLEILEKTGNFKAESIICVGGGSKNALWNKIKANTLKLPIHLIAVKETTVLGAALFAFTAIGSFKTVMEARDMINYKKVIVEND